jgi:tetratricopeptide (TPR) repeat protein
MGLRRFIDSGGLAIVVMTLCLTVRARADEANDIFQKGAAAYREGRYEQAIELFRQAYEQRAYPELVYNTGQAYEKLGDTAHAIESFREYLKLAPNAEDRATVEKRIQALEERMAQRGLADVSVSSTPPGARVSVDGRRLGVTPWSGKLKPGAHAITLTLQGHDTLQRRVDLGEKGLALELNLSSSAQPGGSHRNDPQRDEARGVQPLTLVMLGVGVAGLGGALGFELARRGAEDDAEASRTQVGHVDAYDRMERDQTIARVLLGVGAAGVAVGGTLLYLDLTRKTGVAVGCSAGCGARFASAF